ncbi:MAG: hypothetical protein V7746_24750 [Halioglobus sp.]
MAQHRTESLPATNNDVLGRNRSDIGKSDVTPKSLKGDELRVVHMAGSNDPVRRSAEPGNDDMNDWDW